MTDWKEQVANFNAKKEEPKVYGDTNIKEEGFFTKIGKLLNDSTSVNMTIKKDDDKLTVSLLPKSVAKDEALSKISPIVMVGTAEEFDTAFFANITASVNKFTEFSAESITFEKSVEEAKEKSLMAKSKKEENKKKKEKVDKIIAEAKKFVEDKDGDKVRDCINKIAGLDPKNKAITGLEANLVEINGTTLF
jgi:PRTRC genetic system protein E